MAVEVQDPHHGGFCYWKWDNGRLFHRHQGAGKWVQCKKISATPARIKAVYEAFMEAQSNEPIRR